MEDPLTGSQGHFGESRILAKPWNDKRARLHTFFPHSYLGSPVFNYGNGLLVGYVCSVRWWWWDGQQTDSIMVGKLCQNFLQSRGKGCPTFFFLSSSFTAYSLVQLYFLTPLINVPISFCLSRWDSICMVGVTRGSSCWGHNSRDCLARLRGISGCGWVESLRQGNWRRKKHLEPSVPLNVFPVGVLVRLVVGHAE